MDEVSIPDVVVAGAQSAEKSSELEALGGMKLPRGQNITTRVPLVLSLQAIPGSEPHALIGGEAGLDAGNEIEITDIGSAIEALTIELAGRWCRSQRNPHPPPDSPSLRSYANTYLASRHHALLR